jgi:hypothetical protein
MKRKKRKMYMHIQYKLILHCQLISTVYSAKSPHYTPHYNCMTWRNAWFLLDVSVKLIYTDRVYPLNSRKKMVAVLTHTNLKMHLFSPSSSITYKSANITRITMHYNNWIILQRAIVWFVLKRQFGKLFFEFNLVHFKSVGSYYILIKSVQINLKH